MPEIRLGPERLDPADLGLSYQLRVFGVDEPAFDRLSDEDTKADLIDGVMIVHSPASVRHDAMAAFVTFLITGFSDSRGGLGEILGSGNAMFRLRSGRKFAPESFFVLAGRVPSPLPKVFDGAPDWVLEVLSPSNRREDLEEKVPLYRADGVAEIWVIDPPQRRLMLHKRQADDSYAEETVAGGWAESQAVAGFRVDASWLWQEPLPNRIECLRTILG
jgi:Uma2 family endonuclease